MALASGRSLDVSVSYCGGAFCTSTFSWEKLGEIQRESLYTASKAIKFVQIQQRDARAIKENVRISIISEFYFDEKQ